MAITTQLQYQAAKRAAMDLGNVARARELARIEAEWAQYQADQSAALTAAQIAAEKARIAELDNVARAKAQAALDLNLKAQAANAVGVTLSGNVFNDAANLAAAEYVKATPPVVMRPLPDYNDVELLKMWYDFEEALGNVSQTQQGQGSRDPRIGGTEHGKALGVLAVLGGRERYKQVWDEILTPRRAALYDYIMILQREAAKTFKRQSWQSIVTMIAIVATVGYFSGAAAGSAGTGTAGTATATTGTTAVAGTGSTAVANISVAGINTGLSTGVAGLNTVVGTTLTSAATGAVTGAVTPGGSGKKGAQQGAAKGATQSIGQEVKGADLFANINLGDSRIRTSTGGYDMNLNGVTDFLYSIDAGLAAYNNPSLVVKSTTQATGGPGAQLQQPLQTTTQPATDWKKYGLYAASGVAVFLIGFLLLKPAK
ncbi:MAG TPA: hypothetical protein VK149_12555 [Sideroxyarcus sp.]|nr:hypothetical protein [Sideroxyarcus sp.]